MKTNAPLNEEEEFEFRARFERESRRPDPSKVIWDEAPQRPAIDPASITWDKPAPSASKARWVIARFEMPDGRIARFEVPEGTTPEQAQQQASEYFKTSQPKPPDAVAAKPWERYQQNAAPPKPWERYGAAEQHAAPAPKPEPSMLQEVGQGAGNLLAGAVRGAGSIGATILAPYDIGRDLLAGRGFSLESNKQRRAGIDGGLELMGADTDSMLYKGGKIAGEIAGTAGVGPALAVGARGAGAAPSLVNALSTGGINVAGKTGLSGLLMRAGGGAVTGGAAAGLVNPEEADVGAIFGGAFPVAAKVGSQAAGSTWRGAKSLVEPLYAKGQEKIVGRALREFAGGQTDDAIRNLQAARELVPGSLPTVGEASRVPSLAALQRATMNTSPEAANAFDARFAANNQARVDVLESLAGAPAAREAAETGRDQAAAAAYSKARQDDAIRRAAAIAQQQAVRDSSVGLGSLANRQALPAADAIKPSVALEALAKRPAMQGFIAEARRLAANKGQPIGNPLESIDGLHYVKLAVDDALKGTPGNALARNQKAAVMDIKNLLVAEMDKVSPVYAQSRKAYQEASKPLNQMDIGDELLSAINPLTGRIRAAQFAGKLTDETAKRATGFNKATLAKTLTPEQMAALNAVRDDLALAEFAQTAGRAVGSNTAQNLAYSNMLNRVGVPDFMRNFAGGQAIGKLTSRAGDMLYSKANQEIAALLSNTMLSPQDAARLMQLRDAANPALVKAGKTGLLGVSRAAPVMLAQ